MVTIFLLNDNEGLRKGFLEDVEATEEFLDVDGVDGVFGGWTSEAEDVEETFDEACDCANNEVVVFSFDAVVVIVFIIVVVIVDVVAILSIAVLDALTGNLDEPDDNLPEDGDAPDDEPLEMSFR